jgi:hypothetical protein
MVVLCCLIIDQFGISNRFRLALLIRLCRPIFVPAVVVMEPALAAVHGVVSQADGELLPGDARHGLARRKSGFENSGGQADQGIHGPVVLTLGGV